MGRLWHGVVFLAWSPVAWQNPLCALGGERDDTLMGSCDSLGDQPWPWISHWQAFPMHAARKCVVLEQTPTSACENLGGSRELELACWFWDPSDCDFTDPDNLCADMGISSILAQQYAACKCAASSSCAAT